MCKRNVVVHCCNYYPMPLDRTHTIIYKYCPPATDRETRPRQLVSLLLRIEVLSPDTILGRRPHMRPCFCVWPPRGPSKIGAAQIIQHSDAHGQTVSLIWGKKAAPIWKRLWFGVLLPSWPYLALLQKWRRPLPVQAVFCWTNMFVYHPTTPSNHHHCSI